MPLDVDLVGVTDTSAVAIPDHLTVNGVSKWREKTGQIPTGVAAPSNSDMFKTPVRYIQTHGTCRDMYSDAEMRIDEEPLIDSIPGGYRRVIRSLRRSGSNVSLVYCVQEDNKHHDCFMWFSKSSVDHVLDRFSLEAKSRKVRLAVSVIGLDEYWD